MEILILTAIFLWLVAIHNELMKIRNALSERKKGKGDE